MMKRLQLQRDDLFQSLNQSRQRRRPRLETLKLVLDIRTCHDCHNILHSRYDQIFLSRHTPHIRNQTNKHLLAASHLEMEFLSRFRQNPFLNPWSGLQFINPNFSSGRIKTKIFPFFHPAIRTVWPLSSR